MMNIVLVCMLVSGVIFDIQYKVSRSQSVKNLTFNADKINFTVTLLLVVASLSALGNFLTVDRSLLAGGVEKRDLLANYTYFYNFWVYTSLLALFFSYCVGRRFYFLIALFFLLLDAYFYAMRVHIVLALMAIIYWINSKVLSGWHQK